MNLPLDQSSSDSEGQELFFLPPSPPSEPPDIRNWFSSYEYESPESCSFPFVLSNRDEDSERQKVLAKTRSPQQNRHATHALNESSFLQRETLNLKHIPQPECLPIPKTEDEIGEDDNQECQVLPRNMPNSPERADNPLKENDFSESNYGSFDGNEMSVEADDDRKEAGEQENSWVSTRVGKRSRLNEERQETRHQRTELRAPFAEKTNIVQLPLEEVRETEILGKWRRPRKNKVVKDPPLKQLRLERWVRRLV
ncbi:ATP-dependent caseinolytic protease/crotonase family protein [Wolffia australiana]